MKLTKALQPLNLADTCEIKLSDNFTVSICEAAAHNQFYTARVHKLAVAQPTHPMRDPQSPFWQDVFEGKLTADTESFLTEVILTGWALKDDDGKDVPFTPELAREVLTTDQAGRVIASKVLRAALTPANFEVVIKN